jgi:hypothetical protein
MIKTKINTSITALYQSEDKFVVVHEDDRDLEPIKVPLPKCKQPELAENYGLHPKYQFYKAKKVPEKLLVLQEKYRSGKMTLSQIWFYLDLNQNNYREEILFIAEMIERSLYGHWVYINGKLTYIDGWHDTYVNSWVMPSGLPNYRDRDRKFFHFARFTYNDHNAYGFNYPKHRREGATTKASLIHYLILSRLKRCHGGIQSMTDDHAEKVFQEHVVEPWKELPFWYIPEWDGSITITPKSKLNFTKKSTAKDLEQTEGTNSDVEDLRSSITYKEAGVKAYDSWKLHFIHNDECGKTVLVDVFRRWQVQKPCLAQGSNIHGFAINTSTVGEFEKGGGKSFKRLCSQSNYDKRGKDGQTASGLYNLFISATEGLDSFVDEYGMSVVGSPTTQQIEYLSKKHPELKEQYEQGMGSFQYLTSKRKQLEEEGDMEALGELIRQFPIYFRECFRQGTKDSGFDMVKIENRLDELAFSKTHKQKGNFQWIDPRAWHKGVKWVQDNMGKFYLSHILDVRESNRIYYDSEKQSYCPLVTTKCAGADPFKFNKTKGNRKSDGGGAVFWPHDISIDPLNKPRKEWITQRFVCTYLFRPMDKNEYAEDMLKMCIYHGCYMFPEIDVPLIWEKFEDWGFSGMLLYKYENGKWSNTPGSNSTEKMKQDIFTEFMNYVTNDIEYENHDDLIEQIRDVEGPENMTFFDLFTAGGYAKVGSKYLFTNIDGELNEEDLLDLSLFIQKNGRR